MRVPVFTYHSAQIDGNTYETNDHFALAEDLRTLTEQGLRVVPLTWVADWILGRRPDDDLERAVALSFDDGCTLDFTDLNHPTWGPQRSFFNILADFRATLAPSLQPTLHATSFVVASRETREDLTALLAEGWITDSWWEAADSSPLLSVENHSWDHNHPVSRVVAQRDQIRGRFDNIETQEECDAEVRKAAAFISSKIGRWPELFAYPWGQCSRYIKEVYFPNFASQHRCKAAFTADGGFASKESSPWAIPRLVFRAHWTNPTGFLSILRKQ
jgi:hypothetical protein